MPYAVQQDIIDRYSEEELKVAFDRNGDGVVDQGVVDKALADASDEIDGYLAGRYPLPLGNAPRVLTFLAVDIALYKGSIQATVTEEKRLRYKDALAFLTKIAEGKISLVEAPPSSASASFTGPERRFTRATLKGM